MSTQLCTLASGSSGNCLLLRTASTAVLIDAGISCKRICEGLRANGLTPQSLSAIFITHEHSDHIAGLPVFLKKYPLPIYTSAPTGRQITYRMAGVDNLIHPVVPGEDYTLGDLTITPFDTPHDAAGSLGFVAQGDGHQLAVATDIGHITESISQAVLGSDLVLLETNYDHDWLLDGPYPYPLKRRILGDFGHLSNEDGAEFACQLAHSGTSRLILGHLSKENNSPERALAVVTSRLEQEGFICGKTIQVEVAPRSTPSPVWQV